jgi:hypothetical protein
MQSATGISKSLQPESRIRESFRLPRREGKDRHSLSLRCVPAVIESPSLETSRAARGALPPNIGSGR